MSLVEDARRLAGMNALCFSTDDREWFMCSECPGKVPFASDDPIVHSPHCPAFVLPRIVSALEAAEHVRRVFEEQGISDADVLLEVGNLVRTLRGEEVKA